MSNAPPGRRAIRILVAMAVFTLAAFLLYRTLKPFSAAEIIRSLDVISTRHIAIALGMTAASFVCLACSDALAVRYTGGAVPFRKIALASFTSVSIGHTLGFAAFSSGALRYRFYTRWGLSTGDVGRIMLFCGITVVAGVVTVAGAACLVETALFADFFRISKTLVRGSGIALLLVVAGYLVAATVWRRPLRIRRFEVPMPDLSLAVGQVTVGTADQLLVSAVLHRMLSTSADIGYVPVAATYIAANAAGTAAHVPGGIGVLEATVMVVVPGADVRIVGALIAFRALYYLLPFALGCLTLAIVEIRVRATRLAG